MAMRTTQLLNTTPGLTPRMLDYWRTKGYITPAKNALSVAAVRTGHLTWPTAEVSAIKVAVGLIKVMPGLAPPTALAMARNKAIKINIAQYPTGYHIEIAGPIDPVVYRLLVDGGIKVKPLEAYNGSNDK